MSKWTVTFEIDDDTECRCVECPICNNETDDCGLQNKYYSTYGEQLANCPLQEVQDD